MPHLWSDGQKKKKKRLYLNLFGLFVGVACVPGYLCGSTPSGGCVIGRCWEACPSWVPVSLAGLFSWLAG